MLSNKPSRIDPMSTTMMKPSQKKSMNLISASEEEYQALNFKNFGNNTVNAKDVAIIQAAKFCDIDTVIGEIRMALSFKATTTTLMSL